MLKSQQQQQLSICLLSGLGLGLGTVLGLGLELQQHVAIYCEDVACRWLHVWLPPRLPRRLRSALCQTSSMILLAVTQSHLASLEISCKCSNISVCLPLSPSLAARLTKCEMHLDIYFCIRIKHIISIQFFSFSYFCCLSITDRNEFVLAN